MPLHLLPLPTPFPIGPVNVYLAEGGPLTLIDAGLKDEPSLRALETGLAAHGYRVEDLQRILLTHHHIDHIGLTAQLVARSGAEVITHPYNVPWIENYGPEQLRHFPFFHRIWEESGVPAEMVHTMDTAVQRHENWTAPAPVTRTLDEGDTIFLAGETWQVFHTPGHAGGLICLWNPNTRTLLANDHLIRDVSSNAILEPPEVMNGPRPKRLVQYQHHLHRMAALEPLLTQPGHGPLIHDVASLVRQRMVFHQRRMQKILGLLAEHPLTLFEITRPIFPKLTRGVDFFLALSEILGHLDLLEEAGQARPVADGALIRWQRF